MKRWMAILALALCSGCGEAMEETLPVFEEHPEEIAEAPQGFFFVIDAAGPVAVIDRDPNLEWGVGDEEPIGAGDARAYDVTRRSAALPRELAQLAGQAIALHLADGTTCAATLGEPALFERSDRWEDSMPASRVVLGAAIEGGCDGARWATLADAPEPVHYVRRGDAPVDEALAAFRALPEHQRIQTEYTEHHAGLWEHHDGAVPEVTLFASGERELVLVDAEAGAGCGDFGGALWALFERSSGGLVLRASAEHEVVPEQVLDVGRDGRLELLSGERLLFPTAEGVRSIDVEVPFYGCSC